jgi:hypothetical protein
MRLRALYGADTIQKRRWLNWRLVIAGLQKLSEKLQFLPDTDITALDIQELNGRMTITE